LARRLGVQGRRQDVGLCQLAESPLRISLECEPDLAEALRRAHLAVIPSLLDKMIKDMVEDSYDLVVGELSESAAEPEESYVPPIPLRPGAP
jgi:predicted DNA-binding protein (MmcQ/YjbR family)